MTANMALKIFSHIPTLKTSRLELRKITERDLGDVYEYSKDPEVSKYLLWHPHKSIEYTKEYLHRIKTDYRIGRFYNWAVVLRGGEHNGKMIGTCGFTSFDFYNNSAEVGYVINRQFWGQNIAPEALRVVINFGFEKLLLHRIDARFLVDNVKSRRVMEKCKMTYEGVLRSAMIVKGEYLDVGVCSILSDEYLNDINFFKDI